MLRDDADAAHDDTPHGLARLGVVRERRVVHRLFELKAARLFTGFLRDGFVNVDRHDA